MSEQRKKAALILADGTVYSGYSFGREGTALGELVFTTGVSSFQEVLTDPSNFGQIVVQTFPSVGGYGVNADDYASPRCFLSGYVIRELTEVPSNYKMTQSLREFVTSQGVVGIQGVDTRAITRHIRDNGSMNAMISTEYLAADDAVLEQIRAYRVEQAVEQVMGTQREEFGSPDAKLHLCMLDFGRRNASIRYFTNRDCRISVLPGNTQADALLAEGFDGFVLSDGPGNPADCPFLGTVQALLNSGRPVLGLGLGHQLMALAQGGRCEKLPHGHRGANQPVKDLENGHVFVTSQNHSYAVQAESLPAAAQVTQVNLNDGSCAGITYSGQPALSVQYFPESVVGQRDRGNVYTRFIGLIK